MKKKYFFVLLEYETHFANNIRCHRITIFGNCLLGYIVTALNGKTFLQINREGRFRQGSLLHYARSRGRCRDISRHNAEGQHLYPREGRNQENRDSTRRGRRRGFGAHNGCCPNHIQRRLFAGGVLRFDSARWQMGY